VAATDRLERALTQIEDLVRTKKSEKGNGELALITAAVQELEVAGEELATRHAELQETSAHLETERRRYREMFHFAPAGYLQTDSRDLICDVNLAASRMLRIEQQRLIGKPLVGFIPVADRKAFRIQLALLHDGQELHNRQIWLVPRDSDPFEVLVDVTPARDEQSKISGFRWLIRDPSKAGTPSADERARRALDLIEAAPLGCFLVDREWTLRFVNRAASAVMKREPEALIGKNLWEAFPDAARTQFADIGHAVMTQRESLEFEEFYEESHAWIEGVAFPSPEGVCVFFRDITKRKRSEHAEAQLAAIVSSTSEAVLSLSPDGVIMSWNPGAERMFGYNASEIAGRRLDGLVPEDRRAELDFLREKAGTDIAFDTRVVHKDGKLIDVSVTRSPLLDENGVLMGYSMIYHDASDHIQIERRMKRRLSHERKTADRLREVDRMKDLFLVSVSHDMRGPLAALIGMALTLRRIQPFETGSEEGQLLERMIANAGKLDHMLTDVLDLDRITHALQEPTRLRTDIGDIARRMASEVASSGRSVRVDADLAFAEVDPVLIERILENMIGNAIKYSGTGDIDVVVRAEPDGVLIAVEDRGPGVPDALKEEIFEPFKRGHLTPAGTGIGLTVVKRFVEIHGGRAWVEDRPDGGASFRVFLPQSAS
jgi:PAS domain S-box-containing protein